MVFRSHTYLTASLALVGVFFFALLCSCLGPDLEPPFGGSDSESAATPNTGVRDAVTAGAGGPAPPAAEQRGGSSAAGSGGAAYGHAGVGGDDAHTRTRADDEVDAGVAGAGT